MTPENERARARARWLWILTALFAFRVTAQPLSLVWDVLPSFGHWQSGALPYGWLLFFQVLILGLMLRISYRHARGRVAASHRLGIWLCLAGGIYFGLMALRLVLGQTLMQGHFWFDRPLPTVFHLVLAAFLLTVGRFHLTQGTRNA
ncbi:MAG: hypothetical protein R3174_01465 [Gammaproteobacteria bacterium]|nr:hypothetical protein [Gammaproteobacteria bacterium]